MGLLVDKESSREALALSLQDIGRHAIRGLCFASIGVLQIYAGWGRQKQAKHQSGELAALQILNHGLSLRWHRTTSRSSSLATATAARPKDADIATATTCKHLRAPAAARTTYG